MADHRTMWSDGYLEDKPWYPSAQASATALVTHHGPQDRAPPRSTRGLFLKNAILQGSQGERDKVRVMRQRGVSGEVSAALRSALFLPGL